MNRWTLNSVANKAIHTLTHARTHAHTHTHTHTHIYIQHTHTHIYIYTTHTHTNETMQQKVNKQECSAVSWKEPFIELKTWFLVLVLFGFRFCNYFSRHFILIRFISLSRMSCTYRYVKFFVILSKELHLAVLHMAFPFCCRSTNWPFGSATNATCITLVRLTWKRSLMWISSARPSSLLALRLTMLDWRYRPCFELKFLCLYILSHH